MSIATTVTKLQALHLTVSGIKSAPTTMPSSLNTAVMPIALTWPAESKWKLQALDLNRQDRTYLVRVYVQPVAQGLAGIDDGYQKCVTLLEAFGQKYLNDMSLGGAVDHIASIADSGVIGGSQELIGSKVEYWGFVFTLTITEKTT